MSTKRKVATDEALGFSESHQDSNDMANIDWTRLYEQWQRESNADFRRVFLDSEKRSYC